MSFFRDIINELREKRLWPVAVALLAALVAIPVFLSKSPGSKALAQIPSPASPVPNPTVLPPVSVSTAIVHSKLTGTARDPFAQQKLSSGKSSTSSSTSGSSSSTGSGSTSSSVSGSNATNGPTGGGSTTGGGSGGSGGSPSPGGSGGGSPSPSPSPNPIPTPKPKPVTPGLTATETYQVTLAMTTPTGGLDTTDSVERLSPLPSQKQALMVELGVLKGGHRVLFLLRPGTVVSGPGTCTPGPIDCEILSLGQEEIEKLGTSSSGGVDPVALFAVTAIQAHRYSTPATAGRMRRVVSTAGQRLINGSTSDALSLFRYEPSLGAVVDLRNLSVGG
jgi:hypothetical protein